MRVNQNNPVNLFAANPAANKAKFASPANVTGPRPDIGSTKATKEIPASKPLTIGLATDSADPVSAATTKNTNRVNGDRPFVFPEGATLQGLMNEWGTGESDYDFTQDGQVNVEDMLIMIRNWQETFGEDPALPPTDSQRDPLDVDTTPPSPLPLTSRTETKSPTPDLTTSAEPANSTPTVTDIPELTTAAAPVPTTSRPDPAGPTRPNGSSAGTDSPLSGLLGAWGQDNTKYDLNADGTVSVEDLLSMIQNWPGHAEAPTEFVTDTTENTEPARRGVKSASAQGKLQQLAEQTSSRLRAEGFGDQPPMNIRELVAQLNLSPKQTDFMMKQMQAKYPQGLGVSMVA